MAELDIGKHCAFQECRQLDFLPIQCKSCPNIFCKLHQKPDDHECSRESENFEYIKLSGETSYACENPGCTGRELIRVSCAHCDKNFCLVHRHQVDHNCEKYEAPKQSMKQSSEHVRKLLAGKDQNPTKPKKTHGRKSKATSLKVALMKMKMKAVGDKAIPATERVFFQVYLPKGSNDTSKPMFFSHCWTVGRVIDKVATLAGLRNDNNVKTAKKLRLFSSDDGETFNLEDTLQRIIDSPDNEISSGCSVIIEFVDDDVTNLSSYEEYE